MSATNNDELKEMAPLCKVQQAVNTQRRTTLSKGEKITAFFQIIIILLLAGQYV